MAGFNTPVQKTNDPTYLGSTQGTDRASLQPLAQVPDLSTKLSTPDYKSDTSTGTGIKGLGDLGSAALTLTDQVIQQNATDTLRKGIDDIRDSFGVAAAADQSSGIAKAVGAGGAEGVTLAQNEPNQPIAINRLGNKIEGLTESYKQGGLSNSAYYAKLEAFVRETKAQFPGYGEVIDSKVAGIVGTTPANALRASLLQDVTNLQNKVQGQSDRWTTFEHTNSDAIHTIWRNYETLKQNGNAPSRAEVEQKVGQLRSREYIMKDRTATLALNKASNEAIGQEAESIAITKASDISGNVLTGMTNAMGLQSPADFQTMFADIAAGKRKPLTPDEKTAVTQQFAILKQQYGVQFDKFANSPLNSSTTDTLASKINNPNKLNDIREKGMQNLKDIEDGLVNEKYGQLAATANWNKATQEAAEGSILRNDKNAGLVTAARKLYGDQGLLAMYTTNPQMVSSQIEGLRQAGWASITQADDGTNTAKEPSFLRQTLDMFKSNKGNDGQLVKTHISDAKLQITDAEKFADPTAGKKAVQYLFGAGNRTLINAFDTKTQVPVFNDLTSKTVTSAIGKMDKTSQQTYFGWANDSFLTVYNDQADAANQTADVYKNAGDYKLNLTYNPESAEFVYKPERAARDSGIVQVANGKLQGFNSAINSMKEVWKAQGLDPTTELYKALPSLNIQPGSPVYKAIQTEYIKLNPPKE